jgi:hypothetical protein
LRLEIQSLKCKYDKKASDDEISDSESFSIRGVSKQVCDEVGRILYPKNNGMLHKLGSKKTSVCGTQTEASDMYDCTQEAIILNLEQQCDKYLVKTI